MSVNLLNNIIINIAILIISFYILSKSISYKILLKQKIFLFFWCLLWTILDILISSCFPLSLLNFIYCASSIIFIWKILKIKLDTAASAYMLAYGLSNFLYFIISLLISIKFMPFLEGEYYIQAPIDFNNPVFILIYIIIASLQFFIARQIFKIKRFKNGFPFLFEKYTIILTLVATGIVVIIASILSSPREINDITIIIFITGITIIGVGMIIWIKRGIKKYYIKKMKERSIEQLEQELLEIKKENKFLNEQNEVLRIANHKIIQRLSALENSAIEMLELIKSGDYSTEIKTEVTVLLDDIMRLKEDYENDISKTKKEKVLPSTKIKGLDDIFKYFSSKYSDNNIDFNLNITGSIPYLVENIIEQSKLETMIGDHLQNALIAVNASDKKFRNVLAIIGLSEDCYEFKVFDSGVLFEANTLIMLGKQRVTTHADTGGSGIGFMTTFKTMKECGASLIINQKSPSEFDYTKSVTVRFDGANQYIFES